MPRRTRAKRKTGEDRRLARRLPAREESRRLAVRRRRQPAPAPRAAPETPPPPGDIPGGRYAKYDRPYAWVRSGALDGVADDAAEQDTPLDLEHETLGRGRAHAWDVVEELVRMRVFPAPANAFEVDHVALETRRETTGT